jgi:prepilin-type N-terminal cleavage/methylation domain-containing protein/prepilin-type processing-associated H-X9-DG protein
MQRPPLRTANAFSLVELLVVIAIVTLLVSVLLPTLSNARVLAQKTRCQANLRQLTTGHLTYSRDNRGWFPAVHNVTHAGFLPINNQSPLDTGYWGADVRLFGCPDSTFVGTNKSYSPPLEWVGFMMYTSYRFSATSAVSTQSYHWYGYHPAASGLVTTRNDNRISVNIPKEEFAGRVISDAVYPANRRYVHPPDMMPMIFDGRHATNSFWFPYTALGAMTNNHTSLNGINVTFLDGHLKWGDQANDPERINVGYAGGESGWMRW